jgi:hypothetical protein
MSRFLSSPVSSSTVVDIIEAVFALKLFNHYLLYMRSEEKEQTYILEGWFAD